jgi:transcriptional regulator
MTKKTRQLRIRITEAQFKKVAEALITERRNKSALVRKALDSYLKEKQGIKIPENSKHNNTKS